MRFILGLILVIFGFIYVPLNALYLRVQKWYLPMWRKDKVIYFAFMPFYWALVIIVTVISWPYEAISIVLSKMH